MLHYKFSCKSCGEKFSVRDIDLYPADDENQDYAHMVEKNLCPQCYYDTEQAERVKLISDFLDTLNEPQRENFIQILEKIYDPESFSVMKELIDVHFQGYEGIRSWGLW